MKTIADLIKASGGPKVISEESHKTPHPVTHFAVQKWGARGIPDEHWALIMQLSGESLETVYEANRRRREDPKRRAQLQPAA